MIDRIWRFERIPDTTGNLQCWKTVGLNYYDLNDHSHNVQIHVMLH